MSLSTTAEMRAVGGLDGLSGLQSRNSPGAQADPGVSGLQPPKSPHTNADLRAACQEFEAIFLSILLREMRATVPRNGLLPPGTAGQIFESLWGQEIARLGARSGPLGIADILVSALSRSHQPQASPKLKSRTPSTEDITGGPRPGPQDRGLDGRP